MLTKCHVDKMPCGKNAMLTKQKIYKVATCQNQKLIEMQVVSTTSGPNVVLTKCHADQPSCRPKRQVDKAVAPSKMLSPFFDKNSFFSTFSVEAFCLINIVYDSVKMGPTIL
jgi:hypothetical protein